jgi:hypothetical protein
MHYELHKNISLQRRVTLGQAYKLKDAKDKIVELERQLSEAQSTFPTTFELFKSSDFELTFVYANRCIFPP